VLDIQNSLCLSLYKLQASPGPLSPLVATQQRAVFLSIKDFELLLAPDRLLSADCDRKGHWELDHFDLRLRHGSEGVLDRVGSAGDQREIGELYLKDSSNSSLASVFVPFRSEKL